MSLDNVSKQTAEQPSAKRLFIVDGHAYAYRAFYAIRQLASPVTGKPTNAIYGFIRMLGKMQAFLQPTHQMVVWDGGLASERMALHPEYKTHRPAMPSLLEMQMDEIVRFLKAANIRSYHRDGIEADDWIATLTKRAVREDFSVVIASSDKDFLQLIDANVGLLNPNDKEPKVWTVEDVRTKTGVEPSQIVDWLSLIGDTVDNIPGVPGIGPGTATKLLKQFGSIEELYRRLDEVSSSRIQAALKASEPLLKRNRDLIQLHDNLPDVLCCDDLAIAAPETQLLLECYKEWGFKTLQQELERKLGPQQDSLL
ncbi:MAG: 5'-3' exonuclease [Verrucomicrobia bacterium]|nr:5'-3' exonuclease [Verrucomicrobiota bacterium]